MTSFQKQDVIPPGSTIGILGSGQLGRMIAIAAKYMGYRVHVLSPSHDSPTGQVADLEVQARYDDLAAVTAFAKHVDVVTAETENIPLETIDRIAPLVPTFPGRKALAVCQNRLLEKQFLVDNQIPTVPFKRIGSREELRQACGEMLPAVLKTATGGYDGKGQVVIRDLNEVDQAWEQLNAPEAILEQWIEFDFEFSIVASRNAAGIMSAYPSILNAHQQGILDLSCSPSGLSEEINELATAYTREIMSELAAVGVLTVEFFYREGEIFVNEMAPRPHNSGHLTIEGHLTSQFEQHVRAICGLLPGSTQQMKPVAMANILGRQWDPAEPRWHFGLSIPNTKLHLYGKGVPEPGRKMGHLTTIADSPEQARQQVVAARALLSKPPFVSRVAKPASQPDRAHA